MKGLINFIESGNFIAVQENASGTYACVIVKNHEVKAIYDYGLYEIPDDVWDLPILIDCLACCDFMAALLPQNASYKKFIAELACGVNSANCVTSDEFDFFVDFNADKKIRASKTLALIKKVTNFSLISEFAVDIYDARDKKVVTKYIDTCNFSQSQENLISGHQIGIAYRVINGVVDNTQFFLKNGNAEIRRYPIDKLEDYAWLAQYAITIEISGDNSQYNFDYCPKVRFLANVFGLSYGYSSPVLNNSVSDNLAVILRRLASHLED